MIIWINGAFGAGKTTLTERLLSVIPHAMEFDPEYVGFILTRWVPAADSGDFQDLPVWRRLVGDFAIGLCQEYRRPLIVPMTLVNGEIRDDIFDRIRASGEDLLHVWLDVSASELRRRIKEQVLITDDAAADQEARQFRLAAVDRCSAAAKQLPPETIVLDAEHQSAAALADGLLTRLALPPVS
jgi:hypothetical protein